MYLNQSTRLDVFFQLKSTDIFFWYFSYFFLKMNVWYSLDAPYPGTSNEYPQHMFSRRKKKDTCIYLKAPFISRYG